MMTPENFAYWLQGFIELHGAPPNAEQWQVIQDHLNLVFNKVTPDRKNERTNSEPYKDLMIQPDLWKEAALSSERVPATSIVGLSGLNAYPFMDKNKAFVTITKTPRWSETGASTFFGEERINLVATLNTQFGLTLDPEETRIVISNSLQPKYADCNKLHNTSDKHLISLSDSAPGICNIGLDSPLIC